MTPDQARFLADLLLDEIEMETRTTRRVLAAVPPEKGDYAPDPKSMNALTLSFHVAEGDVFFLESVAARKFAAGEQGIPPEIKTPADVIGWYDARIGPALEKVRAMSAADLTAPVDFFGKLTLPAVRYLGLALKHGVHHRGQLSAYLRPMGGKVPSIFGPSGDEGLPG